MDLKPLTLALLSLSIPALVAEEKAASPVKEVKPAAEVKKGQEKISIPKNINDEGVLSEFFEKTVGDVLQEGKYDEAITKIKTLLDAPELSKANKQSIYLNQLHSIYMEKGDVDAAIKALKDGIALDPQSKLAKEMEPQLQQLEKNKDALKKSIAHIQKQQEAAKKVEEEQASGDEEKSGESCKEESKD